MATWFNQDMLSQLKSLASSVGLITVPHHTTMAGAFNVENAEFCTEHPTFKLNFWCEDQNQTICEKCLSTSHLGQKCEQFKSSKHVNQDTLKNELVNTEYELKLAMKHIFDQLNELKQYNAIELFQQQCEMVTKLVSKMQALQDSVRKNQESASQALTADFDCMNTMLVHVQSLHQAVTSMQVPTPAALQLIQQELNKVKHRAVEYRLVETACRAQVDATLFDQCIAKLAYAPLKLKIRNIF